MAMDDRDADTPCTVSGSFMFLCVRYETPAEGYYVLVGRAAGLRGSPRAIHHYYYYY